MYILYAAAAGLFTWGMTALGALCVLFVRGDSERVNTLTLGFSSGVMIAASFWSLLEPAVALSDGSATPAVSGFLAGGALIMILSRMAGKIERMPKHGSYMSALAITLHNIPEGLAVGVAFGALANDGGSFPAATALAAGIGVQNFPEGAAVALPLRGAGLSRRRSFFFGQLSGAVEPAAAVAGAALVTFVSPVLPYALSMAAGAMIFVVIKELLPERGGDLPALGAMAGFAVMTGLDVWLR